MGSKCLIRSLSQENRAPPQIHELGHGALPVPLTRAGDSVTRSGSVHVAPCNTSCDARGQEVRWSNIPASTVAAEAGIQTPRSIASMSIAQHESSTLAAPNLTGKS